ncbi:MAG TPA: methyltransferase domain-containing protein [Candidatus Baltobacteraceae bacterium]|jgi:predicted RNA methylase
MWHVSGRRSGQRFDAENGVTTEALLFLGELDPEAIGAAMADATHYEPVPIDDFNALLAAVPANVETSTFVDLGSGMGRGVMLASLHRFKQIIGVEVSPALHEVARENLRAWRKRPDLRCADIRLVNADASTFAYPPGDLVVFLYNPFGAATLSRTLERLVHDRAHADAVYIAYHTPQERTAVEGRAAFELVTEIQAGRIYCLVATRG